MTSTSTATYTDLPRSYRIPLGLLGLAIPLGFVKLWLGAIAGLFGLFLLVQVLTLTLRFTDSALEVASARAVLLSRGQQHPLFAHSV